MKDSKELREMSINNARLAMGLPPLLGPINDDYWKDVLINIPSSVYYPNEVTRDLKEPQREMIEKLMYPSDSNPFEIDEKYREILKRVLYNGWYHEGDIEALNYIRDCYLNKKHWIE